MSYSDQNVILYVIALLFKEAMSCLECMMLYFSDKHNLQVFELDL